MGSTANLATNIDATYPDDPARPDIKQHQVDTDTVHRVAGNSDMVIRWIPGNPGQWKYTTRPSWMPWGITLLSTNAVNATDPSTVMTLLPGDVWEYAKGGGPA